MAGIEFTGPALKMMGHRRLGFGREEGVNNILFYIYFLKCK
jgi:hypothetical protein